MEFLKLALAELYDQFVNKINAYNGAEENKDKQIKLANLATGDYVAKGKYDELNNTLASKDTALTEANKLIDDFKKNSKGNEALQGKITEYEGRVQQLEAELQATKLDNAIKVALLTAKVTDVDYLAFKLKEKGELELDEKGNIKGIDEKIAGLKTQLPNFFEGTAKKVYEDGKLPGGEPGGSTDPETLADAIKAQYENKN